MKSNPSRQAAQWLLLLGSGLAGASTLAATPGNPVGAPATRTDTQAATADAQAMAAPMLAKSWQDDLDPARYWVSEKLDGVRALWDGKTLRFRSGRAIAAPAWFLAGLPSTPLDGELWIARHQFDQVSGTVRRTLPVDAEWHAVRYMVFDLPGDVRTFSQRAAALTDLVGRTRTPWLQAVPQSRIADARALNNLLTDTTAGGGEGLVLHHQDGRWKAGRSDDVRKLKAQPDEEGRVIAHIAGKGKFEGRMGALLLQAPDGQRFALGSGFNDAQRDSPPPPGAVVTYRYRDRTASGLPRFATFLRVYEPD